MPGVSSIWCEWCGGGRRVSSVRRSIVVGGRAGQGWPHVISICLNCLSCSSWSWLCPLQRRQVWGVCVTCEASLGKEALQLSAVAESCWSWAELSLGSQQDIKYSTSQSAGTSQCDDQPCPLFTFLHSQRLSSIQLSSDQTVKWEEKLIINTWACYYFSPHTFRSNEWLIVPITITMAMSQNWVMVISEQHRYQGVSYKSDIIVISGNSQQSILENICLDIIFHYKDKEINSVLMTLKAIFVQMKMAGLDTGDRQALEQKYSGCDPPCLLDSSDGRSEQQDKKSHI